MVRALLATIILLLTSISAFSQTQITGSTTIAGNISLGTAVAIGPNTGLPPDQLPVGSGWHDLGVQSSLNGSGQCFTPAPPGSTGCESVLGSWGSGAMMQMSAQMCVNGGGHVNYSGNEIYCLTLTGSSGWTWVRITNPTSPYSTTSQDCLPEGFNCSSLTVGSTNGFPQSVHPYNGLTSIPNQNRMVRCMGSKAVSGNTTLWCWSYDFTNNFWTLEDKSVVGSNCSGATAQGLGGHAVYDNYTGHVFINSVGCLYELDPVAHTTIQLVSFDNVAIDDHLTSDIDPIRHLMVYVGCAGCSGSPSGIVTTDITPGSAHTHTNLTSSMTGCTAIGGQSYNGIAYDPVTTLMVVLLTDVSHMYYVNVSANAVLTQQGSIAAKSCVEITGFTGGPTSAGLSGNYNGLFKRWSYAAFCDCFVYVGDFNQDSFIFRLPRLPVDQQQFVASSASPQVFRALGLNVACDLTDGCDGTFDGFKSNDLPANPPVLDNAVAGTVGAIKFTVPAQGGPNDAGSIRYNFNPIGATTNQFGTGGEFWVKYRVRWDNWGTWAVTAGQSAAGPKFDITGAGQSASDVSLEVGSCTILEQTTQDVAGRKFIQMYTSCGNFISYEAPAVGSTFDLEPGLNGQCLYQSTQTDCYKYLNNLNTWVDIVKHVKINEMSGPGKGTSKIELWAAPDGQPLQTLVSVSDAGIYPDNTGSDPHSSLLYGKVWLLPYISNRDNTVNDGFVTHVWYDKLELSRGCITVPGPLISVQGICPATLIKATDVDSTHVTVTWQHNDLYGLDTYIVERCPGVINDCGKNPAANFTQIAITDTANHICTNLLACSFTDSTVTTGHTYSYRVRPVRLIYGITYKGPYTGGLCYLGATGTCDPTTTTP